MTKLNIKINIKVKKILTCYSTEKIEDPERVTNTDNNKQIYIRSGTDNLIYELAMEIFDNRKEIQNFCSFNSIKTDIEKTIDVIFINPNLDKNSLIDNIFKQKIEEWKQLNTFFIPFIIQNLHIEKEIKIGNVDFYSYSEKIYLSLLQDRFKDPLNKKYLAIGLINSRKDKPGCIATIEINAHDDDKAIELAEREIDKALNILRFFTPFNYNFGILGRDSASRIYQVDYINIDKKSLQFSGKRVGSILTPTLKKETIDDIYKYHLKDIQSFMILNTKKRTNIQNRLLLAINWYGEIVKDIQNKDNIINIFTAFEILFLLKKDEIRKNLPERIAFIYESEKNKRKKLIKFINKIYSKRNELVHEGYVEINEKEFKTILVILRKCVFILLKYFSKYSELENLISDIDDKKITGKLSFQRKKQLG